MSLQFQKSLKVILKSCSLHTLKPDLSKLNPLYKMESCINPNLTELQCPKINDYKKNCRNRCKMELLNTHIYMTADIPRYDLLYIIADIIIIPLGIKILKNDI